MSTFAYSYVANPAPGHLDKGFKIPERDFGIFKKFSFKIYLEKIVSE